MRRFCSHLGMTQREIRACTEVADNAVPRDGTTRYVADPLLPPSPPPAPITSLPVLCPGMLHLCDYTSLDLYVEHELYQLSVHLIQLNNPLLCACTSLQFPTTATNSI